jgi:hypothetical protein
MSETFEERYNINRGSGLYSYELADYDDYSRRPFTTDVATYPNDYNQRKSPVGVLQKENVVSTKKMYYDEVPTASKSTSPTSSPTPTPSPTQSPPLPPSLTSDNVLLFMLFLIIIALIYCLQSISTMHNEMRLMMMVLMNKVNHGGVIG